MVELPSALIGSWQQAIVGLARLKGLRTLASDAPGLKVVQIARRQKKSLVDLWKIFTTEREDLSPKLLNDRQNVVNYLLGFHLANSTRLSGCLQRCQERHPQWSTLRDKGFDLQIFDLGCGTGALSQVLVHHFTDILKIPATKIDVHLIDQNRHLLDAARIILSEPLPEKAIHTHRFSLNELRLDPESIFFRNCHEKTLTVFALGYVWNELGRNLRARQKLLELFHLFLTTNKPFMIFILEPGQEHQSRNAMKLRDQLATEANLQILYPCPESKGCPMLLQSRDWCYSEFSWKKPKLQAEIDQLIDVKRDVLAASAYIMTNLPDFVNTSKKTPTVVGRPESSSPLQAHSRTAHSARKPLGPPPFHYLLCNGLTLEKTALIQGHGPRILRGKLYEQGASSKQEDKEAQTGSMRAPNGQTKPWVSNRRNDI